MAKLRGGEAYPIYFGAGPEIIRLASDLRKNLTPVENLLWSELRNRKMMGFKFRRQHPCHLFILDFFCYEALISIELDGGIHQESYQEERDLERSRVLNQLGITELRFSNWDIERRINNVLDEIARHLTSYLPSPKRGKG